MLRSDLIELINTRRMWAFVGSGLSIDSGCSDWRGLLKSALEQIEPKKRKMIVDERIFSAAEKKYNFPKCFQIVEKEIGRDRLEQIIKEELCRVTIPGKITKEIADWPFAGYITTNYDHLLETALSQNDQRGWVSIGNIDDEIRKVSGDTEKVIWHIHGSILLRKDSSSLVVSENDYDQLYLEDGALMKQLKGLLSQRRIIFFGFGLQDPELMRILKIVSKYCIPTRPAHAFFGERIDGENEITRKDLFDTYNVDVVPYTIINNSHKQLDALLDVYGSMIPRRSINFGNPSRPCPSYDPETTGLLIYNELCLQHKANIGDDVLKGILISRILSLLKFKGDCTIADLISDLSTRIMVLRGLKEDSAKSQNLIEDSIEILVRGGYVDYDANQIANAKIKLTVQGKELVLTQASKASLLGQQFSAALSDRSRKLIPKDTLASSRVAKAAESFFKGCINKRALGMAMAMNAKSDYQSHHIVALLQSLPDFMKELRDNEEAISLSKLVRDIFAGPDEAESKYIGLALQANFGTNLLGFDQNIIQLRLNEFKNTLFLVDSTTLIPFLARSSKSHDPAYLIVSQLKKLNSHILTIPSLINEVAEHASYAIKKVDYATGRPTIDTYDAASGRKGERSNAFLEGFIKELSIGKITNDLFNYLESVIQPLKAHRICTEEIVENALTKKNIVSIDFNKWEGFNEDLFDLRDQKKTQIAEYRTKHNSFKHDRQCKAEAEALIVISKLREKKFKYNGNFVTNAYFISHTRAIDEAAGGNVPITMRPESVLQWITTLTPCSIDELSTLTNSLLWELAEKDLTIVDKSTLLTAFTPLLDGSRDKLEELLEQNKNLISSIFGVDSSKAFMETNEFDLPFVVDKISNAVDKDLLIKLEQEKTRRQEAEANKMLSDNEREELLKLRLEKKLKRQKARRHIGKTKKKKKKK